MRRRTAEQYMFDIYHFLEAYGEHDDSEEPEMFYLAGKDFLIGATYSDSEKESVLYIMAFKFNPGEDDKKEKVLSVGKKSGCDYVVFRTGDFEVLEMIKNRLNFANITLSMFPK